MKILVDQLPTNPHECPFYKAKSKRVHIKYPHCGIDELVCCPSACQHLAVMIDNVESKNPIGFKLNDEIDKEDFINLLSQYFYIYRDTEWDGTGSVFDTSCIKQYMEKYNINKDDILSRCK